MITKMKLSTLTKLILGAALLGSILASHATTAYYDTPAFRGLPGTQSGVWDVFTSAYGGANTPSLPSGGLTLANATITQTADPGAFLTGTANIYDFAAPTGFILNESAGFDIGTVIFQTRTLGSALDYNSVSLTYDLGAGPVSVAGTRTLLPDAEGGGHFSVELGPFGLRRY
jgi:hypothetical protein